MVSRRRASPRRPRRQCHPSGGRGIHHARGEQGYNLVMLVVAITLLNIAAATVLPLWSYVIRRDREEETIFRGLQYAEAIRVFRQRNGRYPVSLEELVKIQPRSIRQLWNEPLSDDGEFGLVVEAPQQQPGQNGQNPGQPGAPGTAGGGAVPGTPGAPPAVPGQPVVVPPGTGAGRAGGFGVGGSGQANLIKLPRPPKGPDGKPGKIVTAGPLAIHGVYLDKKGDSLRKFFGKDKYEQWTFTAELIPPPVAAPGRPLPRIRDDWLGKSFPDGLGPAAGSGSGPFGQPAPGTEVGGNAAKPGQKPTAPGKPGTQPEKPKPEPGTPGSFPEDVPPPDEPPNLTPPDEQPPGDEEPPPDEPPEPDRESPDASDQGAR